MTEYTPENLPEYHCRYAHGVFIEFVKRAGGARYEFKIDHRVKDCSTDGWFMWKRYSNY